MDVTRSASSAASEELMGAWFGQQWILDAWMPGWGKGKMVIVGAPARQLEDDWSESVQSMRSKIRRWGDEEIRTGEF